MRRNAPHCDSDNLQCIRCPLDELTHPRNRSRHPHRPWQCLPAGSLPLGAPAALEPPSLVVWVKGSAGRGQLLPQRLADGVIVVAVKIESQRPRFALVDGVALGHSPRYAARNAALVALGEDGIRHSIQARHSLLTVLFPAGIAGRGGVSGASPHRACGVVRAMCYQDSWRATWSWCLLVVAVSEGRTSPGGKTEPPSQPLTSTGLLAIVPPPAPD